jgi:quinoprotein glucose dehydrogenase
VHHDVWDHDNPCPPVLVEWTSKGRRVEAVAQPTKTGFVYVFDRLTGKPLHEVREIPVPGSDVPGEKAWPTQPRPVAPPPLARQGFTEADITNRTPEATRAVRDQLAKLKWGRSHIPPSVQGTVVSPGFHGGATWSGASYDPDRGLLYLNTNDVPYISVLRPNAAGGYDFGGYTYFSDHEGYPAQRPPWGWLNAVDVAKGRIAWRIPFGAYPELERSGLKGLGAQSFGGTIVTGGGLVFIGGSPDEKFRAYDADTGKELWSHPLPAGGYATPCTYMVGGKQYVVIAAGGGGKLGTRSSDTYVAFALP